MMAPFLTAPIACWPGPPLQIVRTPAPKLDLKLSWLADHTGFGLDDVAREWGARGTGRALEAWGAASWREEEECGREARWVWLRRLWLAAWHDGPIVLLPPVKHCARLHDPGSARPPLPFNPAVCTVGFTRSLTSVIGPRVAYAQHKGFRVGAGLFLGEKKT